MPRTASPAAAARSNLLAHVYVGRLAPSPTGLLHLGHARTFLVAWWRARNVGGRLVMRLEDLDGPRAKPEMAEAALRDLAWLGLDWDGPDYLQSTGLLEISAAAAELSQRGLAYACVCSRSDVRSAQSAPQLGENEPRYPGTCRGKFASLLAAEQETGKPAGLRLQVPDGNLTVNDNLLGARGFDRRPDRSRRGRRHGVRVDEDAREPCGRDAGSDVASCVRWASLAWRLPTISRSWPATRASVPPTQSRI